MSNNSTANIDFSVIFEDRPLKYVAIIFSVVMIVICVCLCLGMLWFEHYGSDLRRILTNRLVSCICRCIVQTMLFLLLPEMVLYFHRPLPEWMCYLQVIFRNSLLLRLILLFDAIAVTRYVCIFCLKNPLDFDDEFMGDGMNAQKRKEEL